MIKKIMTAIRMIALISLPLLFGRCGKTTVVEEQPEEPGLSYTDRYGIFQEKDEKESSDFTLRVGDQQIRLYEMAKQNVKAGGVEVALNEFLQSIEGPIELYHRGVKKPFKMINLRKYSYETGDSRLWKPYPAIFGDRLGPEELKEIREKVGIGSGIQMRLESEADSVSLYASLWVKNPFGGYVPPMKVRSNYFSQVYGFQLIQKDDRPVILRIDTTAESTKHVLDLYRNKSTYKVLHIPGFKTRRRMWREDLFSNKDIIKSQLLDNPYDLFFLPEYVNYEPRKLKFRWGKMESRFNSENYTLAFFRKNIQEDYRIWVGDTPLKVKNAHVIIKSSDTRPELIVTSDLNHPEVVKRLFRIGKNCSVYLDKIVVEDKKGKTYFFPESFAFHLEKSKEFELELAETRTIEEARLRVRRDGGELRIECTSMPLSELLAFLLEAPASNILLSGFNEEIYLDMLFASSSLGEKEGKELMLIKLQHYLKFVVERVESNPVLGLYVQDTTLLNKREAGEWEDRKVKFSESEGLKKMALHNIPISELVELIAYDLNIPCVDLTETESNYSFSLQYEDKADLTTHLQDYGLRLDWYEENVQIMVSRY
jgi:hypothetical protein